MASLVQKAKSFLQNHRIRTTYIQWIGAKVFRCPAYVNLPGGGRGYATEKFNDFYGIVVQHPRQEEFRSFSTLLEEGGVFVDVGANMGLTTVVASKTGRARRIVAFEPTHSYAAVWHKNVKENNVANASLFQCAVGEKAGLMDFVVNPNAPLHNRLNLGDALKRYETFKGDRTYLDSVSVLSLDQLCESLAVDHIQLLKIDVEGAEPGVMRGARRMLERKAIAGIYTEFIPEFMEEMGEDVLAYANWIYSLGYVAFRIENDGAIGAALTARQLADRSFSGLNVVLRPE